jgi:L-histidine N-alpha-methyltransferase
MINNQFAKDVDAGLSTFPKKLSSKYFYDDAGDKIFQKIMAMPSYYVTKAEYQVLEQRSDEIVAQLNVTNHLNIYELGAGDGTKTILLLKALTKANINFTYYPIDISADVLDTCEDNVKAALPSAKVEKLNYTYDEAMSQIHSEENETNLIVFLGSNLGNLYHSDAIAFLKKIQRNLGAEDWLMMGLDKMKNPATILAAYNDEDGITQGFNLNILHRMNSELGGNFDVSKFTHWPVYNPESGTCTSYLVSAEKQEVRVNGKTYTIAKAESIHTEISQKYNRPIINWLCKMSGLTLEQIYTDEKEYFLECLVKRV